MSNQNVFTHTDSDLLPVLDELKRREPIFHTAEFGSTRADFEHAMASEYWETGASGRRYSREFILSMRSKDTLVDADEAGWKATGFGLRQLGPDCFLLTYTLDQAGRLTRRATIWERAATDWRLVYHQGTVVSANEDDTLPRPEERPAGSRGR